MDIEKIKAENITHEEHMNNVLQDIEYQKMYLDTAIQEFITEGDYDLFFQSLEQVVKARMSISEFSQKRYYRQIIKRTRIFFTCCLITRIYKKNIKTLYMRGFYS